LITTNFLEHWAEISEVINGLCGEFDRHWRRRRRIIDSALLAAAIMKLSWSKNTEGYGSNLSSFWKECKSMGLLLRKNTPISASSFCEARMKLDEEIFRAANWALIKNIPKVQTKSLLPGLRVFAIDGSIIDLPRPLSKCGYQLRSEKSHYPQGLLSCLYNLNNGVPYDFQLADHMNERLCACEHLNLLGENDVIIYDRGYFSYVMLWHHVETKVAGIFRLRAEGNFKAIQEFIECGKDEEIISVSPEISNTRNHILKHNPEVTIEPLKVRLIKCKVEGKLYYFATTVFDRSIRATQIVKAYEARWAIEELYKVSKCLIGVEDFHGKTDRGVKQELYAGLLLITLTRIAANKCEDEINATLNKSKKKKAESKLTSKIA
jgi:Transposase DDE domain